MEENGWEWSQLWPAKTDLEIDFLTLSGFYTINLGLGLGLGKRLWGDGTNTLMVVRVESMVESQKNSTLRGSRGGPLVYGGWVVLGDVLKRPLFQLCVNIPMVILMMVARPLCNGLAPLRRFPTRYRTSPGDWYPGNGFILKKREKWQFSTPKWTVFLNYCRQYSKWHLHALSSC